MKLTVEVKVHKFKKGKNTFFPLAVINEADFSDLDFKDLALVEGERLGKDTSFSTVNVISSEEDWSNILIVGAINQFMILEKIMKQLKGKPGVYDIDIDEDFEKLTIKKK